MSTSSNRGTAPILKIIPTRRANIATTALGPGVSGRIEALSSTSFGVSPRVKEQTPAGSPGTMTEQDC